MIGVNNQLIKLRYLTYLYINNNFDNVGAANNRFISNADS